MATRTHWLRKSWALLLGGVLLALAVPYLVSAYYLEAGGRALDEPALAEENLGKAIEWEPNNAQAYRLLGKLYRAQGDFPAAADALTRYTELLPNNPLGHIELAEVYEAIEAQLAVTGVQNLDTRIAEEWRRAGFAAEDFISVGEVAQAADRDEEAGVWYERAVRLAPEWEEAYRLLGETPRGDTVAVACLEAGKQDALQKLKWLRPGDLYANYHLWEEARQAGDLTNTVTYSEALTHFPLAAIHPTDERVLDYAIEVIPVLQDVGLWDRDKTLNAVSFWVWQHPGVTSVEWLLQESIARYPAEPDWPFYLAELYHRRGDLKQAEMVHRQVLEMDPHYMPAYLRLGMLAEAGCGSQLLDCAGLSEAADWYAQYHQMVPDELSIWKRLIEVCAALEQAGTEDSSCYQAAERVRTERGYEIEESALPAEVLWESWLEQASSKEPQYTVGQELESGWTLLGYDVNEDRLIRGEAVDLLIYWAGPGAVDAGSEREGWYRAGERWVQVLREVQTLMPNGGFELGIAGFPYDIYNADSDTRQVVTDFRQGSHTSVGLLDNNANEAHNNASFASVRLPVSPDEIYLQAGWIKSVGGNGYLGRSWTGDIAEGIQPYDYVADSVTPNDWQHYAGVAQPPEGTTGCHIWLLNFMAEGQVYFDNVLFVNIGLPGE